MADLLAVGWACLLAAVVGVCFVVWERVAVVVVQRSNSRMLGKTSAEADTKRLGAASRRIWVARISCAGLA